MTEKAEERLLREIKDACEQHPAMQITVDVATTDEIAKKHGWPDVKAMREGVRRALAQLPPEVAKRIVVKTRAE